MRVLRVRSPTLAETCISTSVKYPVAAAFTAAAGVMAAAAFVNWRLAKKAQRENPPQGQFVEIDGVRVHYVERGTGPPLVLLHGNGSMIQDFESSGLIDLAAKDFRVFVFDRPGFGHSDRPRNVVWTPDAQAELIKRALDRLGVSNAIVLGHSWGASVAVVLASVIQIFVESVINPGHPEMVFRVRMHDLEPGTTYYYKVSSQQANGRSDPATSGVSQFTTRPVNSISANK